MFFNDPVPCPDPAERAVKMAMAMREEAGKLIAAWRRTSPAEARPNLTVVASGPGT